jgi:hypothetical protein
MASKTEREGRERISNEHEPETSALSKSLTSLILELSFGPGPKLLGFHVRFSLSLLYAKERHCEGQRKEVYYTAQDMHGKRQSEHSAHLQPSLGHRQAL